MFICLITQPNVSPTWVLVTLVWTNPALLKFNRYQPISPKILGKNCRIDGLCPIILSLLHMRIGCSCSYTLASVVWRRTCRQLIYSRAILKGGAPSPEVINLPQPICDGVSQREEGSARTSETARRKVVNIPGVSEPFVFEHL